MTEKNWTSIIMTDQELEELQQRNAQRLAEVKLRMGDKWLLHPANKVTKEKWQKVIKTSTKRIVLNNV
jgi:hypothetical protein